MTVYFYALFVHLSLNVYIFLKGLKLLEDKKTWRTVFASIFIVEFALYLAGLYLHPILPDNIVRLLWLMGSTWMVFLFYMTLLWMLIDLMLYLNRRKAFMGQYPNDNPRRTGAIFFIATSVTIISIMVVGNYKFKHPTVTHLDLHINKKVDGIPHLRIAVISDIHLGYLIDKKMATLYADLINEQKPDLILFVGDIIDAEIAPLIQQKMDFEFQKLKAPLGIFSCTGNHEYRYEAEAQIAWLNDKAGIKMIRDSAVLINNSFYIVGREDEVYIQRKELKTILEEQKVDLSLPMIVLNHTPNKLDEEMEAGADIALYGHTHDGQIFPFNIFTRLVFEVGKGYKKKENTNVYVSSGLGLSGPQYRIGTKSEIAVLDVTFNN